MREKLKSVAWALVSGLSVAVFIYSVTVISSWHGGVGAGYLVGACVAFVVYALREL